MKGGKDVGRQESWQVAQRPVHGGDIPNGALMRIRIRAITV